MKLPSISLNQEDVLHVFVKHGDKMLLSILVVTVCGLLWGGVHAIRHETALPKERPAAISAEVKKTEQHITEVKKAPKEMVAKKINLGAEIDKWRGITVEPPKAVSLLDKPLFAELQKRTQPAVFPIENLRAVAGIVILAVKEKDKQAQAQAPAPLRNDPNRDIEAAPGNQSPRAGVNPRPVAVAAVPEAAQTGGRIVPYVIVTGLIPLTKQFAEYERCYASTSMQDKKRDLPIWSEYRIERLVIAPAVREIWEPIDLKLVAKQARDEWRGSQIDPLTGEFVLEAALISAANPFAGETKPGKQPVAAAAMSYCAALPQLNATAWGSEALHPTFVAEVRRRMNEKKAAALRPKDEGLEPEAAPDALGAAAAPGDNADAPPDQGLEYRLFRFIDTAVESGKTYRYRVRLSVWNPNFELPLQHLVNASIAKPPKLPSDQSNESAAVTVPGTTSVLARCLRKAEKKALKKDMVEVLVLGKNDLTDDYSLRSLITELGGLLNVDKQLNKTGDQRTRGADIVTDGVLVDLRGRQEDRSEAATEPRSKKPAPPPEPFELLYLDAEGALQFVTAADSQAQVERNEGTLPPLNAEAKPRSGERTGQPGSLPGFSPFDQTPPRK